MEDPPAVDNDSPLPSIALASLFAVLPGVVLLTPAIAESLSASIVSWLCFAMLFGVTLNSPSGRPLKTLILGAFCVTLVVNLVVLFQEIVLCNFSLSGVRVEDCSQITDGFPSVLIFIHATLLIGTLIATVVACYARPLFLSSLSSYLSIDSAQAKKIERNVNLAVKVVIPAFFTFVLMFM